MAAPVDQDEIAYKFLEAAKEKNEAKFDELLPHFFINPNNGFVFNFIISDGTPYMVRKFIEKGANVNDRTRIFLYGSPLHTAVRENKLENARVLLEAGADVDIKTLISSFGFPGGYTPLYIAVSNKNVPMIELLLSYGANPNASIPQSGSFIQWVQGLASSDATYAPILALLQDAVSMDENGVPKWEKQKKKRPILSRRAPFAALFSTGRAATAMRRAAAKREEAAELQAAMALSLQQPENAVSAGASGGSGAPPTKNMSGGRRRRSTRGKKRASSRKHSVTRKK